MRRLLAVANRDAVAGTIAQIIADHPSQPRGVDDDPLDRSLRPTLELGLDQLFAPTAEQGLSLGVGQRAHALAASRRQYHRRAGPCRHGVAELSPTRACAAANAASMCVVTD